MLFREIKKRYRAAKFCFFVSFYRRAIIPIPKNLQIFHLPRDLINFTNFIL